MAISMLPFFIILHPLVDACSVTVLVVGGMPWQRVLAYNALAFALQFPLGVALDARPRWVKGVFVASLVLTLAGVGLEAMLLGACGVRGATALPVAFGHAGRVTLPCVALVAACVGNALVHLSAGKAVLDEHEGRGGPIGLFISTGALGLFAGMKLAGGYGLWCCLGFGAALAAVVAVWWLWRSCGRCGNRDGVRMVGLALRASRNLDKTQISFENDCGAERSPRPTVAWCVLVLAALFVLVAWRSWAGLLAGGMTNAAGLGFALAGAAVTWAGKAAGGYLGDRFGRWVVTTVSVVGSLSLCFLCRPEEAALWLALLFVAQLATGPVLSLMYDKSGRASGTAFGLNGLALFTGSL